MHNCLITDSKGRHFWPLLATDFPLEQEGLIYNLFIYFRENLDSVASLKSFQGAGNQDTSGKDMSGYEERNIVL